MCLKLRRNGKVHNVNRFDVHGTCRDREREENKKPALPVTIYELFRDKVNAQVF